METLSERIAKKIVSIPDYPKKGVIFRDVAPVTGDAELFRDIILEFARRHAGIRADYVVGVEARGFIFGAALAKELGCGFVPIRKPGKLPRSVISEKYQLEYGEGSIEIQSDAFPKGSKVIVVDDLLATGGTVNAAIRLIRRLGGEVLALDFLVELGFLNPRPKIQGCSVIHSLLNYQ